MVICPSMWRPEIQMDNANKVWVDQQLMTRVDRIKYITIQIQIPIKYPNVI